MDLVLAVEAQLLQVLVNHLWVGLKRHPSLALLNLRETCDAELFRDLFGTKLFARNLAGEDTYEGDHANIDVLSTSMSCLETEAHSTTRQRPTQRSTPLYLHRVSVEGQRRALAIQLNWRSCHPNRTRFYGLAAAWTAVDHHVRKKHVWRIWQATKVENVTCSRATAMTVLQSWLEHLAHVMLGIFGSSIVSQHSEVLIQHAQRSSCVHT
mmetsp:Transcript_55970/g.130836  ORF Transcript_55970/g.130836 Transcript_55970/m.130836 type:complete len:210 (-) Transcript_55970:81-710(-)